MQIYYFFTFIIHVKESFVKFFVVPGSAYVMVLLNFSEIQILFKGAANLYRFTILTKGYGGGKIYLYRYVPILISINSKGDFYGTQS